MTRPLTDEMLEQEQFRSYLLSKDVEELWHTRDDMRAAADWQLEQVIEWIEEKGLLRYVYGEHAIIDTDEVVADLKKALRPQQQENN